MSNVIELLERIGSDAELNAASPEALAAALDAAGLSPDLRAAFLARDRARIEALLGARTNVVCGLFPGKDDKDEDEDDDRRDDDEEIRARRQG